MAEKAKAWPPVPKEHRPKQLPHLGGFSDKELAELSADGYAPIDIRFLEGAQAVRAWLEAGRLGLVELSANQLRTLQLEAEIYGLRGAGKGHSKEESKLDDSDIESLLAVFPVSTEAKPIVMPRRARGKASGSTNFGEKMKAIKESRKTIELEEDKKESSD
jgi:hypothetical protein